VKPAPFAYFRPDTLDEALARLAEHGPDAKPLAGGQSLVAAMNFRLAQPTVLVDLNRIPDMAFVNEDGAGGLRLGGMTRHRTLETSPLVRRLAPLLAETMPFVAHPPIRARGTIGGSLAHADPAAELPAVCLALGAQLTIRSASACRTVAASDFFTGLYSTVLGPAELVVDVHVPPLPAGTGWAVDEVARRHGDFALAGAAAAVTLDHDGQCTGARVALFSAHDRPVLATQAIGLLEGQVASRELLRAAAERATLDVDPPSDIHASSAYRRHLVRVLVARVLTRAFARARTPLPSERRHGSNTR
jgi:aerobic carbon-monoxide dehydrogenase medium subunit